MRASGKYMNMAVFGLLRRQIGCLGITAALALLSFAASAQEVPGRTAAVKTLAPVKTMEVPALRSAGATALPEVIDIALNKARVVDFDVPVRKIVVGNERVADVHFDPANPSKIFVISRGLGSTNVFFMGEDGAVIHQLEVRVTANDNGLKAALLRLMPNEHIDVARYGDSVFLTGTVSSAAAAANAADIAARFVPANTNVSNLLKVSGSQQVILQVRVSEMDRDIRKNLSTEGTFALKGRAVDGLDFTTTSPATTVSAFASGTVFQSIHGLGPVTFEVLERQNLVKTLAEPTLTAISGQTATFLSGGETPVPTGVDESGNAIIQFREFGIRLEFTPIVQDKGRINMKIATEISSIDTTNTVTVASLSVNGFTTKRTETTIDLPSGGSLMISGLLEENINDTVSGFPYLKDIPVLGALFRSTEFQREETELVVTVTAYLAEPTGNDRELSLPTDGFESGSDIDIYLLGRLQRQYGKGEKQFWNNPLKGPFGYIMK